MTRVLNGTVQPGDWVLYIHRDEDDSTYLYYGKVVSERCGCLYVEWGAGESEFVIAPHYQVMKVRASDVPDAVMGLFDATQ